MTRALRIAAVALTLVLAAAWGAALVVRRPGEGVAEAFARLAGAAPPSAGGVATPAGVRIGGPFALRDGDGRPVTEEAIRGKVALITFGYTFCPDVCPTELQVVAGAMDLLGDGGRDVRPVFITIDPERDTPARMKEYVALFHPALIGLTGTPQEVAAAARAWRVYYARVNPPGSTDYLMDHSAYTYLMGRDGSLRRLFSPGTTPEEMAAAVRASLG